jgi:putative ATP-binding cassette transporter
LRYPGTEQSAFPFARLETVLEEVGLGSLAAELDDVQNWSQRLSLGEQQRLAFARIFLIKPKLLFLDEATSALDEACEAKLYGLLRNAPWRPTIVSVGHRSTLRCFHDQIVEVAAFTPLPLHPVYLPDLFLEPRPAFAAPPLPRIF